MSVSRTTSLKNNQVKSRTRAVNPQNGKKRREGCCGYSEKLYHSWVVSRRTSEKREVSGKPEHEVSGSIRLVRFTQSMLRQASVRGKIGTSLGTIQVKKSSLAMPQRFKN